MGSKRRIGERLGGERERERKDGDQSRWGRKRRAAVRDCCDITKSKREEAYQRWGVLGGRCNNSGDFSSRGGVRNTRGGSCR